MKLQLYHLVKISNNSRITQELLNKLNEKLDDADIALFLQWLKIIENNKSN